MKTGELKDLASAVLNNTLAFTDLSLCGNGARKVFLDTVVLRAKPAQVVLCHNREEVARLVYIPQSGGSIQRFELWLRLAPKEFGVADAAKALRSQWEIKMRKVYAGRVDTSFKILTRFGRLNDLAKLLLQQ